MRLEEAADDVRNALAQKPVPAFQPKAANGHRLTLVAATFLLFAAGITFFVVHGGESQNDSAAETMQEDPKVHTPLRGSSGTEPVPVSQMDRPQIGAALTEPDFQTRIEALTDTPSQQAMLPLQVRPAWNSDGSYLLFYQTGGDDIGHVLYETATASTTPLPINPVDIEEVYWDPTEATLLYYVEDTTLVRYDVSTAQKKVLHRFGDCESVSGVGSLRLSSSRMLGQLCEHSDGDKLIAYDIATGEEVRADAVGDEAPQPTPTSGRFVARDAANVVSVLDETLQSTGVRFAIGNDPYVVVETTKGDVLATVMFSDDDLVGSLVTFNLDTGEPTVVVGEATGYPYPPAGTQLMVSVANNALVTFATATVANGEPVALEGELVLVDLDAQDMSVQRLAHHRSDAAKTQIKAVWSTVYPALHPDGNAIAFASDWGQDRVDTFLLTKQSR